MTRYIQSPYQYGGSCVDMVYDTAENLAVYFYEYPNDANALDIHAHWPELADAMARDGATVLPKVFVTATQMDWFTQQATKDELRRADVVQMTLAR